MRRAVLAGLRAHALRLVLASTAILLGVGFVTGTLVLGATSKQAFFDQFARAARNVDTGVLPAPHTGGKGDGPATLPPDVLNRVRAVPGVVSAAGRVRGAGPLLDHHGRLLTNFGSPGEVFSVPADRRLAGVTVVDGRLPGPRGEAVLDRTTAGEQHFHVGDTLTLLDRSDTRRRYRLVGIVDPGVFKSDSGTTLVGLPTAEALAVSGENGYVEVDAIAAAGTGRQALTDRIAAAVRGRPGVGRVLAGPALARYQADQLVKYTSQFLTALLIFGGVAFVVAALVISNTFAILVAQRLRELALLRCVGATRGQVLRGVLAESAAMGLAGALLGGAAGVGLAAALRALVGWLGAALPSGSLVVTPTSLLVPVLAGLAWTVAAALPPAVRATRIAPVAALGQRVEPARRRTGWWWVRIAFAVGCAAGGVALAVAGVRSERPSGLLLVAGGGCVFFVAVLAVAPLVAGHGTALVGWLPARLLGVPTRLAVGNARRHPGRVAATTLALTIGVGLMTLFTVAVSTAEASASQIIEHHYPADFILQARSIRESDRSVPPAVADRLRHRPEVGTVTELREHSTGVGGRRMGVGALDPAGYRSFHLAMASGSVRDFGDGTVLLLSRDATAIHARTGGTVTVDVGGRRMPLRVAGTYSAGFGPAALVTWHDFGTFWPADGDDTVYVTLAKGVPTGRGRAAVDRIAATDPLIQVGTVAEYKRQLTGAVDSVLGVFAALLGLAMLIALIGIANTLSLSVLERRRESALLRALGLTAGQLRRMLVAEAVLMAVLGALIGVALGGGFGWAVGEAFLRRVGEGRFSFPIARVIEYVAISAVAGAVASVIPARRAGRTSLVADMAED
ncbi:MAG: ABC transporter permease [Mycobacteriales bacterium]